jgi:hypothetical protein
MTVAQQSRHQPRPNVAADAGDQNVHRLRLPVSSRRPGFAVAGIAPKDPENAIGLFIISLNTRSLQVFRRPENSSVFRQAPLRHSEIFALMHRI